jgi:GNAT superfamily N-acetyltransferase
MATIRPATETVAPTSVAGMRASAEKLLRAHWEEVAKRRDLMVLAPDWDRYEALESAGVLVSLGAFVDGRLVGYSVTIVGPHLHYVGLIYGQNDVIYVAPEHRKSRIGLSLIRETERLSAERGAKLVSWHAKEGTSLHAMLPRLGYSVHETIFTREL